MVCVVFELLPEMKAFKDIAIGAFFGSNSCDGIMIYSKLSETEMLYIVLGDDADTRPDRFCGISHPSRCHPDNLFNTVVVRK